MLTLVTARTASDARPERYSTGSPSLEIVGQKKALYSFARREQLSMQENTTWQIIEGYVRCITWNEAGDVMTLGIWGPTDLFGQPLSIVDPYQVECLTQVRAIAGQAVGSSLFPVLLNNVQQTEKLLSVMQMRSVSERFLGVLNWLAERFGQVYPTGRTIGPGLTHQQFAELTGTTRVTITRLLQILESAGKIRRLPRRNIMLID